MRRAPRLLVAVALAGFALAGGVRAQDVDEAQRKAQEAQTAKKLDDVRAQIKALTEQRRASTGERDEATRALREKELALAAVAKDVRGLDDKLVAQQQRLDDLGHERADLETKLAARRADLAKLLRSAYALGNHEELKLLLQQDDVAAIARALAYHRYFQRAQLERIDALRGEMRHLVEVEDSIHAATAELAATREARNAEGARLESERGEREKLVADLEGKLKAQGAQIASLGRNETELSTLLERLRDVFADIPQQIKGEESFAAQRGKLRWPLQGRVVSTFGASDDAGRRSSGVLLAAKSGTPVRAISHGRVAFADWLRGYGLVIIVDHGDGYLSLYGCNETLLKDVGDWVDADDTIATSGASGGQKAPGLYFELRAKGQAIDPRGWMR